MSSREELKEMAIEVLQRMLKDRRLSSSGNKNELIERLLQAWVPQSSSTDTIESALFESRFSGEYTIQAVIGRGGFGVVFKAQHKLDERLYAIKRVNVAGTEQSRNKVLREVRLMAPLDHPHIVRYYDAWLEQPPPGWQQENYSAQKSIATTKSSGTRTESWLSDEFREQSSDVPSYSLPRSITISLTSDDNQSESIVFHHGSHDSPLHDDASKGNTIPIVDSNLRYLYIRMELCCDQTLRTWLRQNQRPDQRPVSQILDWFNQLVSAIKYIHDSGLIHRDIKPQNIFFGSSRNGAASVLKIGDLGLATYAAAPPSSGVGGDVSKSLSVVGTPSYMSPEQRFGHYKNSTDIFSLGLVFLEMVHPFKTDREQCGVFGALQLGRRPDVMDKLDKKMGALIGRMTAFEPKERPTASELDNELSCSDTLIASSSEHPDIGELSVDDGILEGVNFTELLPPEPTLKTLWKSLYQEVFEYSLPLLHVGHGRFEFCEPQKWPQPQSDESIVVDPWEESFKQLKNGIHVRPGCAPLYSGFSAGGRCLTQCDRLDQALQLVEARGKNTEKLIFLHTGLYIPEATVTIDSDIQIIGASAGPDIASRVIIEGRRTTTVKMAKGSQGAYLGWMTVRFAPDARNPRAHTYHNALRICDNSTALVEHCVIHLLTTLGAAVYVHGSAANPKMRHCVICNCESAGIYVTDAARGQFEDCEIARNNGPGIKVNYRANPFFRRCHIHDGRNGGIFTFNHGMGYFESCNIHNNRLSGIEVANAANPTVTRCEVHHEQNGVYVRAKGRGQFTENRIHSNALTGITIESHSDPKIWKNKIYNGWDGIRISGEGHGLIEENEVYGNTFAGIHVTTGSSPIIRKNRIHSGKQGGVFFHDNGYGLLEENDIFNHLHSGVLIRTGSNPKITRNKIRGNQKGGVFVYNNGQGVLEDNEIFNNAMPGVWIETDGNPTLRRNKIYDGRGEGVCISDKGRGVLESNAIFKNRFKGLFLATGAKSTLRDNKIYDNDNDNLVEETVAKGGCLIL